MTDAAGCGYTIRPLAERDIPEAQKLMMRSIVEDFGDEHDPTIHADVDHMADWYLHSDRAFLLVAEDHTSGQLLGTAGLRSGRLKDGLSPQRLTERYRDGRTGQLVRVYVLREHRRRGLARALVQAVLERNRTEALYEGVALHTFQHSPGAMAFWGSMGAQVVEDDTDGVSRAVFLEFTGDLSSTASAVAGSAP